MRKQAILLIALACMMGFPATLSAQEEEVAVSTSLYAGLAGNYSPWKSFSQFSKEYNTVNATSLKSKLGSLSDQYGTELGIECFVAKHLYASAEWNHLSGKTSAKFNNGSKRYFSVNTNAINTFIGWKQITPKGAWIIATGFGVLFGNVNGWVKFPDGTEYYSTEGFSGEFKDVNVGIPLKFDYERNFSKRFSWRLGLQSQFYTGTYSEGMQNVFGTLTVGAIEMNGKLVKMDLSGVTLSAGIVFNFYTLWED